MSKACCALTAEYRWCLTGTPYQNNVDDIYSLIKFLRIPPFEEWSYWRERITKPSKNDQMRLALTRLRTLLRALMLRRTKDVLKVRMGLSLINVGSWGYASRQRGYYRRSGV